MFVSIFILAWLASRIFCLYKALGALGSNTKALAFIPSIGDVEFMSSTYLWSGGGVAPIYVWILFAITVATSACSLYVPYIGIISGLCLLATTCIRAINIYKCFEVCDESPVWAIVLGFIPIVGPQITYILTACAVNRYDYDEED